MATVYRTRTTVERVTVSVDEELGFEPHAAVAVARTSKNVWQPVSDAVTYEVHDDAQDGCTVAQLSGRVPKEE
jgi:hypothetical protein